VAAPPKDTEVLKRAGLILAVTAWETYVEDRARQSMEAQLNGIKGALSPFWWRRNSMRK